MSAPPDCVLSDSPPRESRPLRPTQLARQFVAALARDWDARLDALRDHLNR
jgi:hypothetical protein